MSTISRGYTLTDGLLNNANYTTLHALVDNATVTAITLSEFATTAHLIQVSATTPVADQGNGSLWFDSTLGIMRVKNADTRWDCQYIGPEMQNSTGSTIPKGAWVVVAGAGTISPCNTAYWPETLGVLTATLTNGSKGIVRTRGIGEALVFGPCTIGDTLITAGHNDISADLYARSLHSTGVSAATLGIPVGMVFAQVGATTALATCAIWR